MSKLLLPFLAVTIFFETAPVFHLITGNNQWFYNILAVIEDLVFTLLFYILLRGKRTRQFILLCCVIYLGWAMFYHIYKGTSNFDTTGYRMQAVQIIIFCVLYFRQLLTLEDERVVLKNPFFWIASASMFFYLGMFLLLTLLEIPAFTNMKAAQQLWITINYSLNTLLYTFFAIAFLCPKLSTR